MTATVTCGLPASLRGILDELASGGAADGQHWIVAMLRRHSPRVVSLLWRMLGREQDVLDAYQNVVCHFASRGPRHVGRNRAAYFYRSAVNAGIEMIRHRQRERERLGRVAERYGSGATQADSMETTDHSPALERMHAAVLALPKQLRDVIVLRDLTGMNYQRVSTIMNISAGTARVYRRQAIVRLSARLAREISA